MASEQQRWDAVRARQPIPGRPFVYAVTSTGVFCVPTCSARRPRRENVRFFDGSSDARVAGFRPCMRCRPEGGDPTIALVLDAIEIIEGEPRMEIRDLAGRVSVSAATLRRAFARTLGISPSRYVDAVRRRRLRAELRRGAEVIDAQYTSGYGSGGRLYEAAAGVLGTTPAHYRSGSTDLDVGYAIADGPLGRYLVATTARGVCFVALGEDDAELESLLRDEYPRARLARAEGVLADALRAVGAVLAGSAPDERLPLDVRATAFQRQVWERLREIPPGENVQLWRVGAQHRRPRGRCAPSRVPARRIRSRCSRPATGWSVPTVRWRAIAGGLAARARCWPASVRGPSGGPLLRRAVPPPPRRGCLPRRSARRRARRRR